MEGSRAASDEVSVNRLMRRLWREHLRFHRGRLVAILGLTALTAGLTGLYPVVIQRAISMFELRDARILYQVPVIVVLVTLAKATTQYFQTVAVQRLVLLTIRELQDRMFVHLSRADLVQVEREPPAQLATRFTTDVTLIREALTRAVNGMRDGITVVGLVGSMLYLDWALFVIAALLYPLAAVPIQRLGKRIRRASGGMQEQMGETAAFLYQSFAQARTVRAYGLEAAEALRAKAAFEQLYAALLRMTRNRAILDPMLEVLGGTAVALVIGFAGWRASAGVGGIGNFSGFVAALLLASQPLRSLGSLNAALQEGLAGMSRVFGLLDEAPLIREAVDAAVLPPGPGRVRFEDVSVCVPGRADRTAPPQLRRGTRTDGRARRAVRCRQEHGVVADPAPRRRVGGADHHRWGRHPDADAGEPAGLHRLCGSGRPAVRRHGGGEHPYGPPRCERPSGGPSGARRGGRVRRDPAARL